MHKLQPNIVTISVIHILLVCCVETARGVGENEVRCYDCDPPDSDAKRNVVSLQNIVFTTHIVTAQRKRCFSAVSIYGCVCAITLEPFEVSS